MSKEISELILIDGIKYTDNHEWTKKEGSNVKIGITDYAQDQLGGIVFVELPEVDSEFEKGDEFGTLESTKAVSELYMPVSGKIVAINEALEDDPELVNKETYESDITTVRRDISRLHQDVEKIPDQVVDKVKLLILQGKK